MQHFKSCFIIFSVTGLTVEFSPSSLVIGSAPNDDFSISCNVNRDPGLSGERDGIVKLSLLKGDATVAFFSVYQGTADEVTPGTVFSSAAYSRDYVDTNKAQSTLTVTVTQSQLNCNSAGQYTCLLDYQLYSTTGGLESMENNVSRNLTVTGMDIDL